METDGVSSEVYFLNSAQQIYDAPPALLFTFPSFYAAALPLSITHREAMDPTETPHWLSGISEYIRIRKQVVS